MYYGSVLVEVPNRRKLEILRFIASRASKGENPPSVREVGAAVGLRSSRSAHAHLERLEEVGYVERSGSGVRTVRLTEKVCFVFLVMRRPPRSTLFPYTTLLRV